MVAGTSMFAGLGRMVGRLADAALGTAVSSEAPRTDSVLRVEPRVRYLEPAAAAPSGRAPGARLRRVGTGADGAETFVLVLSDGDEALTALADFARAREIVNAHFVAIGAVRDPEVGWFDLSRRQYKAMSIGEQMEVLTLTGDIALGQSREPVVHAHLVLGRSDGSAWGGHLLRAITSPTLEVYIRAYPEPLHKRLDAHTGLQLIDPTAGEE
jgi:hypothetical protein